MRLPNERLMSPTYFKRHADKLVERQRKALEISLNSTKNYQMLMSFAVIIGVIAFLIAFQFIGFFSSLLAGGGTFFLGGIAVEVFAEKHPPEYGVWHCVPNTNRKCYSPGGTVTFTCTRIANGEVVEEIRC